jgi:hypothetical protein
VILATPSCSGVYKQKRLRLSDRSYSQSFAGSKLTYASTTELHRSYYFLSKCDPPGDVYVLCPLALGPVVSFFSRLSSLPANLPMSE